MSAEPSLVDKESITLGRYLYAAFDIAKRGLQYFIPPQSSSDTQPISERSLAAAGLTPIATRGSDPSSSVLVLPSIETRTTSISPATTYVISQKIAKSASTLAPADVQQITSTPIPAPSITGSFLASSSSLAPLLSTPASQIQLQTAPIGSSSSAIGQSYSSSYFPVQQVQPCTINTSALTADKVIIVWTTESHYISGTTIANTSSTAQTYTTNLKLFTDLLIQLHNVPNCQNAALELMNFYYNTGGFSSPDVNNNLNDPNNNYYNQGRIEVMNTYVQMVATYVICNTNITVNRTVSSELRGWFNDLYRRFYYRYHNVENNLGIIWIMYVFLNKLINSEPVSSYTTQVAVIEKYFSGTYNRNINGASVPYIENYKGNYVLSTEKRQDRTYSYHNYYLRIMLSLLVFIKSLGIPINYTKIQPQFRAVVTTFISPNASSIYAEYSGAPTQIATPNSSAIQTVKNLYEFVFNNVNLPNHTLMIYNVNSDIFIRALQSQRYT